MIAIYMYSYIDRTVVSYTVVLDVRLMCRGAGIMDPPPHRQLTTPTGQGLLLENKELRWN